MKIQPNKPLQPPSTGKARAQRRGDADFAGLVATALQADAATPVEGTPDRAPQHADTDALKAAASLLDEALAGLDESADPDDATLARLRQARQHLQVALPPEERADAEAMLAAEQARVRDLDRRRP
ncbi:MAG: hypothetical protein R8K47_00100 [Mariprofundaceae bacterium]